MKGVAPLCFLIVPLAALAVASAGPGGAAIVALVSMLIGTIALLFVQGDEAGRGVGIAARRAGDLRFLVVLVVVGFVLRVGLAVLLRQLDLNMVLGGDEGTYDRNARFFAGWLDGTFPEPFQARWRGTSQVGYFVLVGTIYSLFGPVQLIPVVLNCAVGALTAIPAHRLASRIGGRLAGRVAAVLVTLFPSLLLWSCLLVRDALAFFLIAWCAVLGQELLRRVTLSRAVLLIGCLGALATIRTYMFLVLAAALVAAFAVSVSRKPGRAIAVSALSVIGVLALVRGAGLGAEFVGEDVLGRIDEQRRLNALGGNAGIDLGGHDLSTPVGALSYLPIGLTYFLLAPFPWQMGGRQVLALPDMLLWYVCLPLAVIGAVRAVRYRRTAALAPLFAGIAISLLYALVEGNVGIIVRHRAQVLVLLLPFAAVTIARLIRARRRRLAAESTGRALQPSVLVRAPEPA
jgi:hypothetical protein